MIASRQEGADAVHGTTMAVGAVAGLVVAAVVTGSLILVVVLATGAVVGAVVAGLVALAREGVRGRREEAGDEAGDGVHALSGPEAS